MEAENSRLLGGMAHSQVPSVTTTLGMSIEPPKAQQHHDDEGQLHKKSSNNSNGKGSHKPEANTR
ncbi:G-box-binding factor 1 [Zea mays]|nr:G-box-binding factor 1 [Zea mays]